MRQFLKSGAEKILLTPFYEAVSAKVRTGKNTVSENTVIFALMFLWGGRDAVYKNGNYLTYRGDKTRERYSNQIKIFF